MAIPSGEAAQMLASTTSKQGLDREARAALLRVKTGPEWPEGNLRELTWGSNPDCGMAIPWKALTWDTARPAHRTKDWVELASCGPAHPLPEAGRREQSELVGGNRGPREASSTKLQAGFVANQDFLGFWAVGVCREGRSQRSVPQKRHTAHLRGHTHCTPRKPSCWDGEAIRCTAHLEVTALAKHLVTWAAQIWEGHKTQVQPSLCLCWVPENLNLSGLDLGSARNPGPASDNSRQSNLEPEKCRPWKHTRREQGQTQCSWNTASTPRTCQWYLFAVLPPPHSRLKKWA